MTKAKPIPSEKKKTKTAKTRAKLERFFGKKEAK